MDKLEREGLDKLISAMLDNEIVLHSSAEKTRDQVMAMDSAGDVIVSKESTEATVTITINVIRKRED